MRGLFTVTDSSGAIKYSTQSALIGPQGIPGLDGDEGLDSFFPPNIDFGNLISPAYASGNFTASGGGTWTVDSGDVNVLNYALLVIAGIKIMFVSWDITFSSVSGSPVALQITIPAGFMAAESIYNTSLASDNGTGTTGKCQVASGTLIYLYRDLLGTAWSNSTNNTTVQGGIAFLVK